MPNVSWRAAGAAIATLLLAAACRDATTVPDLNNLPSSTIGGGLTPTTLNLLVTGLANRDRTNIGFNYLVFAETMARDVYNLDPSEARFITEALGPDIDPGGFAGGSAFLGFYNALTTANTILAGLPGLAKDGMTPQQVAATTGFVQTLKALALYHVFETRGPNGMPADAAPGPNGPLPPVLCQSMALARISALLDSAYANLQAAGATTFPFAVPAGFSVKGDFSTPAGFAKLNRALAGRTAVYRGVLAQAGDASSHAGDVFFKAAIVALNASFLDAAGDPSTGAYYLYSTAPNETTNPIAAPTVYLNPQVADSLQPGDRRSAKIVRLARARTLNRVTSQYQSPLADPANLTGSIPLMRNAELVLLRAQANIGLGNLGAATADVNAVRTAEGGLVPYDPFPSTATAIRAVLYEKRYSLLLTGAHRLVDLRAYGLLTGKTFKQEIQLPAPDAFNAALPIPKVEIDARGGSLQLTCG